MTIVDYKTFDKDLEDFNLKHGVEDVKTSSMKNDSYTKEYIGEDGAILYVSVRPYYETKTVEVKNIKVNVQIKLFETEYWSSDNSKSKFYYEVY